MSEDGPRRDSDVPESVPARLLRQSGFRVDPEMTLFEGQDLPADPSGREVPTPGEQAARFTDPVEIGRGGMGVVFRVWDEGLRRELAMKVIRAGENHVARAEDVDPKVLSRFLEEAQIAGQLDHPGIVPVHEAGVDVDGDGFMICEGDCDDARVDVNPDALELCADELDSDCDGELEPSDMDSDDDGFDSESCGGGDCADDNADIHPGASDVCDDVIDSDCDGSEENCLNISDSSPLVGGGGCSACSLQSSSGPSEGGLWLGLLLLAAGVRRRRGQPRAT